LACRTRSSPRASIGIEADVRPVGQLQQLAELDLVIDVRQHRPQAIARLVGLVPPLLGSRPPARRNPPVLGSTPIGSPVGTALVDRATDSVGAIERPAFGEDHDELAFRPERLEMRDQLFERDRASASRACARSSPRTISGTAV
jgi:hypothetical protein